jgi:hypothetical protein
MRKNFNVWLLFTVLCTAAFAQNESDFRFDGRGTITGYEGWDTVLVIPSQIGGVAVTAIGNAAFQNGGFTSVTLPASIRSIGDGAFWGNKLTGSVAIRDGVSVGFGAFANNQLTSLTVGDRVSIGSSAFSGNQLASLTIGNGVSVGGEAFSNHRLTSLTVGNGGSIAGNAFGGNSLRNIVLGADINFGLNTFSLSVYYDYMCNSRRAGTYDNTVTYTGKTEGDYHFIETRYGAVIFYYTGNEGSRLIIPRQLGGKAVKGIRSSEYGDYSGGAFGDGGKNISRMQLPDGLVFIGNGAFWRNQLTSVTIPDSVTYIGGGAFYQNQLTSVTIGNSVTYIGHQAFGNSPNVNDRPTNQLTSVIIPDSVTYIGYGAFYRNRLTSVTIPDSVTSIGDRVFSSNQLTSVTIPDSVTSIGNYAFYGNQLTSVTIPDSVTSIGYGSFYAPSYSDNQQLTSIIIGANITLQVGQGGYNDRNPSFGNDFVSFYNQNGKKAGTYTYNDNRNNDDFYYDDYNDYEARNNARIARLWSAQYR